jgi:hypothetical protein
MRIYIAGAYTKGDIALNIREAILMADKLIELGHIPYIPHLTHFWHLISPKEYRFWLEYDNNFIDYWAEGLLRLNNSSAGADGEVTRAQKVGIPIYYDIKDLPKLNERL